MKPWAKAESPWEARCGLGLAERCSALSQPRQRAWWAFFTCQAPTDALHLMAVSSTRQISDPPRPGEHPGKECATPGALIPGLRRSSHMSCLCHVLSGEGSRRPGRGKGQVTAVPEGNTEAQGGINQGYLAPKKHPGLRLWLPIPFKKPFGIATLFYCL